MHVHSTQHRAIELQQLDQRCYLTPTRSGASKLQSVCHERLDKQRSDTITECHSIFEVPAVVHRETTPFGFQPSSVVKRPGHMHIEFLQQHKKLGSCLDSFHAVNQCQIQAVSMTMDIHCQFSLTVFVNTQIVSICLSSSITLLTIVNLTSLSFFFSTLVCTWPRLHLDGYPRY